MGSNFSLLLLNPQRRVHLGEDFDLVFEIKNNNNTVLKVEQITLNETSYFHQCGMKYQRDIEPFYSSENITMSNIKVKDKHVLASEIPTYLEFSVMVQKSYVFRVPNDINRFTDDLFDKPLNPDIPFNFLIYGKQGIGKSSFINSCYTLIQNRLSYPIPIGGSTTHITQSLNKYPLIGTSINLWDTWGVGEDNYKSNELTDFLEGVLPHGWEMTETKEKEAGREVIEQIADTKRSRQIHAIIIIIGAATVLGRGDPAQDAFNRKLKEDIVKVQLLGYNPLIVLNKADECIKKFSIEMLDNIRNEEIEGLRARACQVFKLTKSQVFCQINYTTQEKPVFNLDRMTLAVLSRAMRAANDFLQGQSHI